MTLLHAVLYLRLVPPDRDVMTVIQMGFVTVDGWVVKDHRYVIMSSANVRYCEVRSGRVVLDFDEGTKA